MDYELWLNSYFKNFDLNGTSLDDVETFNNIIFKNRFDNNISFCVNEVYRKVIVSSNTNGSVSVNFEDFTNTTPMTNIMYLAETILGIKTTNYLKKYFKK